VRIDRIVAAVDGSEASREGLRTAVAWGAWLGARVTAFHVAVRARVPVLAGAGGNRGEPVVVPSWAAGAEELELGYGLPSVEIARFAERSRAGLVVLGRRARERAPHLPPSDTADAVARRSSVPCLFVPRPLGVPRRVLVALDGTERGHHVLGAALGLAARSGVQLSCVFVEPAVAGESSALARLIPSARAAALQRRLEGAVQPFIVSQGDPETGILDAAAAIGAELIVVGYRRGSQSRPIQTGSVARRIAHCAPCAVLTVPL
jgi:nucleotide-binding universal stress UspA family protein